MGQFERFGRALNASNPIDVRETALTDILSRGDYPLTHLAIKEATNLVHSVLDFGRYAERYGGAYIQDNVGGTFASGGPNADDLPKNKGLIFEPVNQSSLLADSSKKESLNDNHNVKSSRRFSHKSPVRFAQSGSNLWPIANPQVHT